MFFGDFISQNEKALEVFVTYLKYVTGRFDIRHCASRMQVNPTAFGPVYKGSEIGSAVTIL
jgi:hypothetical protein